MTEERDKWIAEWEALNKERDKIEDERDRYRILRDAASEASLRLRMSNIWLDADCAAIRAERDKAVTELQSYTTIRVVRHRISDAELLRGAEEMTHKPLKPRGFWSWVMRQKPFGVRKQ